MATFHRNSLFILLIRKPIILIFVLTWTCQTEAGFEPRNCLIFSKKDYRGDLFHMSDFDQSVNLRRDYRNSIDGWWNSTSAIVRIDCVLSICDAAYFQGSCISLPGGAYQQHQISIRSILSANCTCTRVCKCSDISIPGYRYGRAYLSGSGGCEKCYSEYLEMISDEYDFPEKYRTAVTALVVRKGCNLTVYSETLHCGNATVVSGTIENFNGSIGSYKFQCNGTTKVENAVVNEFAEPPLIELPSSDDELFRLLFSNKTLAKHPGILAAVESLKSGRSSRHAYILMIGTGYLLNYFDLCTEYQSTINECHIPVILPELGISNAQLRIIYAEAIGDHDEPYEDQRWLASLDNYLSNHDDLKDRIPNAVVIQHFLDDDQAGDKGSLFQRKLQGLSLLQAKVLDETYSNVIFLLHISFNLPRNPEPSLVRFEGAIGNNYWSFPLPNHLIVYDINSWDEKRVKVNGNWKMRDQEYYPRNAFAELKLICKKGNDPLGFALMTAAFEDNREFYNVTTNRHDLLVRWDPKVDYFKNLLLNPLSQYFLYRDLQNERASRREMHFGVGCNNGLLGAKQEIKELEEKLRETEARQQETESRIRSLENKFEQFGKSKEKLTLEGHASNLSLTERVYKLLNYINTLRL